MMSGSSIPGPLASSPILRKRITISGSTLRERSLEYKIEVKGEMVKKALPGIIRGYLQNPIKRVFFMEGM